MSLPTTREEGEVPRITHVQKLRRFSVVWLSALGLSTLLGGCGIVLFLRWTEPFVPPVTLLQKGFPKYEPTLFERYVPRTSGWGWAWKMRAAVLGNPRAVNFSFELIRCADNADSGLPGLPLEKAAYSDTNGVQVWFLSMADLHSVTERLKTSPNTRIMSKPRLSTSAGVRSRLAVGEVQIDSLSEVGSRKTDLYMEVKGDKHITLDKGLRLQVPHGDGVLVFNTDLRTGIRTAVSITLNFPGKK